MKKKLILTILTLSIILTSLSSAIAVSVSDFGDIQSGDWFYSAVNFVIEKNMFNGTSSSTFSPQSTMERGMFVTVLGRYGKVTPTVPEKDSGIVTKDDVRMRSEPTILESNIIATLDINTKVYIIGMADDLDDPSYSWYYVNYDGKEGYIRADLMEPLIALFIDVPEDEYFAGYVYWAYNSGIADKSGYDTFSPHAAITREQICSMLYNYALSRNYEMKATKDPINFTDASQVNPEYAVAVTAMQRAGVIDGYPDRTFRPTSGATRAEVSAMLMRFILAIGYTPANEPSFDASGNYIWGAPAPAGSAVSASYLDDACFIGHSLIVGMQTAFKLPNTDFYAFNGASARSIMTYTSFPVEGNENGVGTLAEAMDENDYGKVYIMLGANEAGTAAYHRDSFYSNLDAVIDLVRQTQPNAKIYLFSFTPVTQGYSESSANLSRDNILKYNDVIKRLCRENRLYYLNVFDHLQVENGFIPESAAYDGLHITGTEYAKIKAYILSHAV
ncbi:MAG: S-layer homology domain-containing protein [Oscillospiraceae bacterium]|jgi:uncharacterized protein YgiM (DUF1202 family)|nr:S-layer homology domain-containing protein [Oscillospiraceae bacterium]